MKLLGQFHLNFMTQPPSKGGKIVYIFVYDQDERHAHQWQKRVKNLLLRTTGPIALKLGMKHLGS